ncbi:protein of unassigned function [Methylobacterium oryzae CBMB20]|uniref:Protein of unassigned function n=1 Tax=Methylobacterium oryzae CBMB20 TaxID=693986 RepID=A0A089QDC3_9HYPH|nr:protein of unassigned function [Methylobacterium oryzae CBMB20]
MGRPPGPVRLRRAPAHGLGRTRSRISSLRGHIRPSKARVIKTADPTIFLTRHG